MPIQKASNKLSLGASDQDSRAHKSSASIGLTHHQLHSMDRKYLTRTLVTSSGLKVRTGSDLLPATKPVTNRLWDETPAQPRRLIELKQWTTSSPPNLKVPDKQLVISQLQMEFMTKMINQARPKNLSRCEKSREKSGLEICKPSVESIVTQVSISPVRRIPGLKIIPRTWVCDAPSPAANTYAILATTGLCNCRLHAVKTTAASESFKHCLSALAMKIEELHRT